MSGLTSLPASKVAVHPMRSPERVAALIKALCEEVGLHDGSTVGSLVARVAAAESAISGTGALLLYTPTTSASWASTAPTTVRGAIDRLAALAKTLNSNTAVP